MLDSETLDYYKSRVKLAGRLEKQILRLENNHTSPVHIIKAVDGATEQINNGARAFIIYGEPQSGKTEMMICLTARLLDQGRRIIVHLMNDSVDLLGQNLRRFKSSGLAPAPKNSGDLLEGFSLQPTQELVVFCKKNSKDLTKLIERLKDVGDVIVIDDEADYATPNGKINSGAKTKIHELVEALLGQRGIYIGVTATPARLNLNNTYNNSSEHWVKFPAHDAYTGQDTFFPLEDSSRSYRLTFIDSLTPAEAARQALVRFLVTSAYLNTQVNAVEENYTLLVHTSGKKQDHDADRAELEKAIQALSDVDNSDFPALITQVNDAAKLLYPAVPVKALVDYVVENVTRIAPVVLNSERDRNNAGDGAADPSSPFTVIIGGNIVSRGVTFPNLLGMFFTRNVASKLQQDTYIQRARMFGARGKYLEHFELTIPSGLYADWRRCFVYHRLALDTLAAGLGSPVWIGDRRVSVASSMSVDQATVAMDRGEMSFAMFDFNNGLDELVSSAPNSVATLRQMQSVIGEAGLPTFLINFVEKMTPHGSKSLGIHLSAFAYESANQELITREKGFIGKSQLESTKPEYSEAVHHFKIFRNRQGKARLFYKYLAGINTVQNMVDGKFSVA